MAPTPVAAPALIRVNEPLARLLGIDAEWLASPEGVAVLAGNRTPERGEPIAMAYAGHQFGGFVPQLGDGRAILLGEIVGRDGVRRDVQLKGCGPTPFSRRGDGRAALGPVLREYIISEAFAALGIPSTRALAAVATGEAVYRETALPGAVLTRVATSHVRVGTFQYFAARGDIDGVRELADYVIARHYPEAVFTDNPYVALLSAVAGRQASLIARWLGVGFIHGVMNTDNMSIAGETIDFGPCAFMDAYHPARVYSSIDHGGRYAYGNQPRIGQWNLARLAECLLPLLADDDKAAIAAADAALDAYAGQFAAAHVDVLRAKLGLQRSLPEDAALVRDLLELMADEAADFTLTFRGLSDAAADPAHARAVRELFKSPPAFDNWQARWQQRLSAETTRPAARQQAMLAANPLYVPRNHLVEEVIRAAVDRNDLEPFERLLTVLARPFEQQSGADWAMSPPRPDQVVLQTFCGT